MHARRLLAPALMLIATAAFAVLPTTDGYLPSVGRGPGLCVGNPPVCAQWRTTAWVFNPSTTEFATVDVQFLRRDADNRAPATQQITVQPGETRELDDVFQTLFGLDEVYGALRFTAAKPVVVTGRISDANVVTNKGSGTAGQFFRGAAATEAIGLRESVDLIGLAQDQAGVWRTNFGFVETTGESCTVVVQAFDPLGTPLGSSRSFVTRPFSQRQFNIGEVQGALGSNRRLRLSVSEGQGKVIAFGSRIDNLTGDPSTVEMAGAGRDGVYVGFLDKTTYDTPMVLTVAGGAVSRLDATLLVTAEDVATCPGGELVRLQGPLTQPVLLDELGDFSFIVDSNVGGVSVSLQVDGLIAVDGALTGTVATTLGNVAGCSGSKTWPLVGARRP